METQTIGNRANGADLFHGCRVIGFIFGSTQDILELEDGRSVSDMQAQAVSVPQFERRIRNDEDERLVGSLTIHQRNDCRVVLGC